MLDSNPETTAVPPDITLRHAERDDLEGITQIYNHYVRHSIATFDTQPFASAARMDWFVHYSMGTPHQLWVAERNGALLGYASSSAFRPKPAYDTSVETSIYLHPDRQRAGIGTLLYRHLFEKLAPFPVHRAFAGIALPNPGSVALHRAFDFELAGTFTQAGKKFGGYHDVAWYEKALDNPEAV